MSIQFVKLLCVPVLVLFFMLSTVFLGYEPDVPLMIAFAVPLIASVTLDWKYKFLRWLQLFFVAGFHYASHINWCELLYYMVIINLIQDKRKVSATVPICVLCSSTYTAIRLTYLPVNKYNLLVSVYDVFSSLVLILVFHIVLRIFHERKNLSEQNSYLTNHDSLTGLLNYDGYMKRIQKLVAEKKEFMLILVDITNFKSFNAKDVETANEILIHLSLAIRSLFADHLGIARYAGDRFAILIPPLERIEDKLVFYDLGIQITYSITRFPEEATTFQHLISTAEERIFEMRRELWSKSQEEQLRSDKMKMVGELAAGMAHEIRNPLTSIKGFIQLSKNQTYNIQPWYDVIMSEITRVSELTAEFLQFSKPHASNMRVEPLSGCLERVYSLCESEAVSRGHRFTLFIPEDDPTPILMDRDKMIQVLINLVRNAYQAMEEAGRIELVLRSEGEMVAVDVTDTGKGIPPEVLGRIFDPFFTTKEDGTGLGLSLCQKIVEDHQGSISVQSEVGTGTTFTVRLPVAGKTA